MMRPANDVPEVFLCKASVDFRKGIRGLSVLVEAGLGLDPFSERLFIFTNRRQDAVKILAPQQNLWVERA